MVRGDAAEGRVALRSLAPQTRIEIASAYRLVRRVTGHCWKELRRAGTSEVIRWFQCRTHPPRPIRQPLSMRSSVRAAGPLARLANSSVAAEAQSQPRPRRLALPGGPYGIAARGRDLAYISRIRAASIERLDLTTRRLAGRIFIGRTPGRAGFDPSGTRAYVRVPPLERT